MPEHTCRWCMPARGFGSLDWTTLDTAADNPQVTATRLRCEGCRGLNRCRLAWPAGFADGVSEGVEIVLGRTALHELLVNVHDVPPPRRGEALGVLGTQVVRVRLGLRGKLPHDDSGVGINVGQRRGGGLRARGTRTLAGSSHVTDVTRTAAVRVPATPHAR